MRETDGQLDDVSVAESTHIFDFTLNTILGTCHIDNVF
jgi:hypothetical protein